MADLLNYFMFPFTDGKQSFTPRLLTDLRNPVQLLLDSISEQRDATAPISRYKLVIETTLDDSIIRQLRRLLIHSAKILKLSSFPGDEAGVQPINVISQVKWFAECGETVILSQTESINESFYDLFNQHFRKFEERTDQGMKVSYHTNIAVGAHSRRCKVSLDFQLISHINHREIQLVPAPFLNRFEKYYITHAHLLDFYMHSVESLPALQRVLRKPNLMSHVLSFVAGVGTRSLYGFAPSQTIESILLQQVNSWCNDGTASTVIMSSLRDKDFCEVLKIELGHDKCSTFDISRVQASIHAHNGAADAKNGEVMLAHSMIRQLIEKLLQVAVPEMVFKRCNQLPQSLLKAYM